MTTDESGSTQAFVSPGRSDRDLLTACAVGNHRTLLVLAILVLTGSFFFQCSGDGQVTDPLLGIALPGVCVWQRYTGLDCPGCGLTRCFISIAHGDLAAALRYHPVGVVLFAVVLAQLPYRGLQLHRLSRGHSQLKHPILTAGIWLLFAGFLVQWLLKISGLVHF